MIGLALMIATLPAGINFTCRPVTVWDGDGPIRCAGGAKVRLRGIAAREIDGTCRPRQPCPRASGVSARDRLVRLLGGARGVTRDGHVLVEGPDLRCRSFGADDYLRVVAACRLPDGRELGCEQVRARVALRWARYGGAKVCR
ncbi:hypothetical protein COA17_11155 [Sphingomonas ginsenosidimutans]|uniref:Nuclease n=1 Tax=Sphingomonas ginsenosidimutans TaxID=862134 RepID=A0A2A4HVZ7_9SPHN|nr:hypothetical protein COA17_11155 [Sphingomonas ginsenosidimutans]